MSIEKEFTINGIIEVTEGGYSGKFFVIDEIDYCPKSKIKDFITFKCSSLNGRISDFKFDNRCSIQIGLLTIRKIIS